MDDQPKPPLGIRCPKCRTRLRTTDSDPLPESTIRRYKTCVTCGYRVVTKELVVRELGSKPT